VRASSTRCSGKGLYDARSSHTTVRCSDSTRLSPGHHQWPVDDVDLPRPGHERGAPHVEDLVSSVDDLHVQPGLREAPVQRAVAGHDLAVAQHEHRLLRRGPAVDDHGDHQQRGHHRRDAPC
jgi:hypothetical protein